MEGVVTIRQVDDGVELRLPAGLADFLLQLPDALDTVEPGSDDPAADRLNVPVYLDDAESNEEWWGFMGEELSHSRAADRSAFREVVSAARKGTVMSSGEAHAMLRVLAEARLVLAARLGIEIESDYEDLDVPDLAALDALGQLQVALMSVLLPG